MQLRQARLVASVQTFLRARCAARRMSHVVIRSFGTVAGDSLSNCSAGAAPSLRSQRLESRPLWCSRLAASDPRITVVAPACSRSASALTSRLTIRPSRRRFAARLNSGVRRGKKHSESVASTRSDDICPLRQGHRRSLFRHFFEAVYGAPHVACYDPAASALSPVIRSFQLFRWCGALFAFGHNELEFTGPCSVRGLQEICITVAARRT